ALIVGCSSSGGGPTVSDASDGPGPDTDPPADTGGADGEGGAGDAVGPAADGTGDAEPTDGARSDGDSTGGYRLHEWGLVTSVAASNGDYMAGLHHRHLGRPDFVHGLTYRGVSRERLQNGEAFLPEGVTQKIGDPAAYFYADRPTDVTIQLDIPSGYPMAWFPSAASQSPKMPSGGSVDLQKRGLDQLTDGSLTWNVQIGGTGNPTNSVPSESRWSSARGVASAAPVKNGSEVESFLYYAALATFSPPLKVKTEQRQGGRTNAFTFENRSSDRIPAVFFFDIHENEGRMRQPGAVPPGGRGQSRFSPAPKENPIPIPQLIDRARPKVTSALEGAGLTASEADAMFAALADQVVAKQGVRMFYILPQSAVDNVLPMKLSPSPDEHVRVFAGSVEILTPAMESSTVDAIEQAHRKGRDLAALADSGRFAEARFRRGCELVEGDTVQSWCYRQVDRLAETVRGTD
ncbi:MAG: hypothetical protein ABEL76_08490, partial [Bradymonadaceae bacterium]